MPPFNDSPMNSTSSLFHPFRAALAVALGWLLLAMSGCAPGGLGYTMGLETDEAYLQRGEAFVTDEEYMAFAMEQAGVGQEGDYYDPDRAARSNRSGNAFTPYMNSCMGMTNLGIGGGWGSPFGGFGYSPYNAYGSSPYGYGYSNGYNPYGYGYGYNPYGNGYNPYNPYGYNPYGPAWGNGGGSWWGSNSGSFDDLGFNVTSGPRIPILTSTGNNSNHGETGLLVTPRKMEAGGGQLVTHEIMDQALGRNTALEVASPPTNAPSPARAAMNPFDRMMASPSLPESVREPHLAPNTEPSYTQPERNTRGSWSAPQPSRPSSAPSRPSTAPSRPSSGGRSNGAPSRSGRGG